MRVQISFVLGGLLLFGCGSPTPPPSDGGGLPDSAVPSCTDGIQNQDESDVDCGGTCGSTCATGEMCFNGSDCAAGTCESQVCVMPATCDDGILNGTEVDVDCGGGTCPSCAPGQDCLAATDCDSGVCQGDSTCAEAACDDTIANGDESDVDCGGATCSPCVDGQTCGVDGDCASNLCEAGTCSATCDDMIQNADETDVDCGGATCATCRVGGMCVAGSDCYSTVCDTGACTEALCDDTILNGDETDIDCGGSCTPCPDDAACVLPADCESGVCTAGICIAPACDDGVLNGGEADVDCAGPCPTLCADGATCTAGGDCESGVCDAAGLCAAPACDDGALNGGETDVDCGGATTCPRCPDRALCSAASDCSAGVCTIPPGRCGTFAGCHWGLISQEAQFTDMTIQSLFSVNGHTFTVHSTNGSGGVHSSDSALLGRYTHIVFHQHDRVLSSAESSALTAWVNAGGRLIVTGYDSLGSPTDSVLATLLRCAAPGDGPFSGTLSVVDATHGIARGPAQTFSSGEMLMAASTDHDRCTPTGGARRVVEVAGSSKLQITEAIGVGRGMVVYWNGNGGGSGPLVDWTGAGGTQPALQNLFVNTLDHLCSAP